MSLTTLAAPAPAPVETVRAGWAVLSGRAEVACVAAWSAACRAWWEDTADPRLRERASEALLVGDGELATWLARRLDPPTLIRAHEHVTCMRAGLERDLSLRELTVGALRSHTVASLHRGGARTVFMTADQVPEQVARFADALDALPEHPYVRGAWLVQAIGAVHPFADANGGTSRFLASLELVRAHLPPLVLTVVQRNGSYIDGLMHANRSGDLTPLVLAFHDVVQQLIATALLARAGEGAAWDDRARERAERWVAAVDRGWRAAIGAPLDGGLTRADPEATAERGAAIARLMRRGYRVPITPAPRLARWRLAAPLPVELDLVIAPVRAGGVAWLVAMMGASVGGDGALGSTGHSEAVSGALIAPATEDDAHADVRFERWLAVRVDQCVRGLARWV
ncbi:MAG TPA: Fic family protein [Kofleriaceae bacterium]